MNAINSQRLISYF